MTADLDLTTLSDTYIEKSIADIQQQLDTLDDQLKAIQDKSNALEIRRKLLRAELERRDFVEYTAAERRQLDADFARAIYEAEDTDPAEQDTVGPDGLRRRI